MNGDGFADFIIGAPKADPNGESEAGESYVVFGNHLSDLDAADGDTDGAIDLSSLADGGGTHGFVLNGISGLSEGDQSGRAVSGAGDVNGDGFADLIIGAPYVSETDEDRQQGEAYVVFGGAGVGTGGTIELDDIAEGDGSGGFVIEGVTEGYSEFGSSVSGAGDVNGDGFDDFLVGRPGDSSYAGYSATYVVFGGEDVGAGGSLDITTFTEADGFLVVNDFQDYDYTGKAVSGAGDVNGDGFDDLLVGAPRAGPAGGAGFNAEGESYVIFGGDFSGAVTHQGGTGADSLSRHRRRRAPPRRRGPVARPHGGRQRLRGQHEDHGRRKPSTSGGPVTPSRSTFRTCSICPIPRTRSRSSAMRATP